MLEQAPEGTERDELINLKQNIEELLILTDDSENPVNAGEGCSGVTQENKKNETSTDVAFEDEYALFMVGISLRKSFALENYYTFSGRNC